MTCTINWLPYGSIHLFICFMVLFYSYINRQRYPGESNMVICSTLVLVVFAYAGARIYGFVADIDLYIRGMDPVNIIWGGSSGSFGVFTGGITGATVVAFLCRVKIQKILNFYTPIALISIAIGRVGCLINGCCYGKPTTAVWAITYKAPSIPYFHQRALDLISFKAERTLPIHPTQLYEVAVAAIGFVLYVYLNKRPVLQRSSFAMFLIYYSIFRILIEFARGDSSSLFLINTRQFLYFSLFVLGIVLYRNVKGSTFDLFINSLDKSASKGCR